MRAAPVETGSATKAPARSLVAGARWLTVATVLVGLLNYLYSLGLTHALDIGDFAVFAAGQALLLTAGTVANSSVPWVLAHELAADPTPLRRRQAVTFALVTNTGLALGAGLVLGLLSLAFAPVGTAAVVGAAGALIFLSSTTSGYLQGAQRFQLLGGVRAADALIKIVAGLLLVLAGLGSTGALAGFGVGAVLIVLVGAVVIGRDLRPAAGALRLRRLWRSAAGVAGVQSLVSVVATVDLLLVAVLAGDVADAAGYQASMILSRVPLFLAGAVSAVVFPMLARASDNGARLVRAACRLYLALALPWTAALLTAPPFLVDMLFPAGYHMVATLLPLTALGGLLVGAINLLTTAYQARREYARCVRAQLIGLLVHVCALLLGMWWAGVHGLAVGVVVGSAATLVLLARAGVDGWSAAMRPSPTLLAGGAALIGLLLLVRDSPPLWLAVTGVIGLVTAVRVLGRGPTGMEGEPDVPADRPGRRLRVLHLGFEDWRKPGSGGGAVRTREVNERLAAAHEVTVLVSNYRGARDRVENGVRYVPVGLPLGYWGGILSYLVCVPFAARRRQADLLVEDFAAPIGSVLPALWSRLPRVAIVQWLDAESKARQYHLPFDRIQAAGVRRHHRMIAMSDDLAATLRAANPTAEVTTIPNGVPAAAFTTEVPRGRDIVFLGRLEIQQKGLDLLIAAIAGVADRLPGRLVLAGDGPDRRAVERLVHDAGLADRVTFAGRVDGERKLQLLVAARAVVMPSRYETFGIVAAEAMACGTPVVAFEIPSLREVVVGRAGVLVPAFDVPAFGAAVAELVADPERIERMGAAGRQHARRYDWDDVSDRQRRVYLQATSESAEPRCGSPR